MIHADAFRRAQEKAQAVWEATDPLHDDGGQAGMEAAQRALIQAYLSDEAVREKVRATLADQVDDEGYPGFHESCRNHVLRAIGGA